MNQFENFFFKNTKLDIDVTKNIINKTLNGFDDGELFFESSISEKIILDDGQIKNSSYDNSLGFGFRGVIGELTSFAHSSELTNDSLLKASETVSSLKNLAKPVNIALDIKKNKHNLYNSINPINELEFKHKVNLLLEIDNYLRSKNPLVKQVSISLGGSWQAIGILRPEEELIGDIRPLVILRISVQVEKNGRVENGTAGHGGRDSYSKFITTTKWQGLADEALRQAIVNLDSIEAPAGDKIVVLGPGWPGVLLHEAVGHGLEGDFNRKKTSTFSGRVGQQVAAKGVTIVDNGTLEFRRGSLNIDDEGTPTQENILIEDGILVQYMQDRMNARLMNVKPTGNGRRESYAHQPMPRMTTTYMKPGNAKHDDLISSVKDGVYAVSFGGGQVDITSGDFVFNATEAYLIENGKVTSPIKGMTLIGNGPNVMTKVKAVADNLSLDDGIGTCGKGGQWVPVGVGQPSLLIDKITVGGTKIK